MPKILVLYYSRTGNTEKMAHAIAEGAKNFGGVEVELSYHVDAEDLSGFDAVLVGAPTYNHEIPIDMERLFEDAAAKGINLKGKVGGAFGSYGWSGEAPKFVLEIMKNKFEMRVVGEPLLAKYAPDQKTLDMCRELGRRVSETLIQQA
ncbi:FprA family A-type flavoprotein [Candidatus Bathyarchaeota archaeon A05DMB-2]|nr:FprA family A-type flavoprotein [Candidatus Bathyarchaeota archaeon A05DMB-2]